MPPILKLHESWLEAHPEAHIGILAMRGVANPNRVPALEARKAALEAKLRQRFEGRSRADVKAHPTISAYNRYYKQFRKTYHVQHQLESVALKAREIPSTAALVEAMFMAELQHLQLTAGHDLDIVQRPVTVRSADGSEAYMGINDNAMVCKTGDMVITDADGVLSSIIYGPDRRSRIRPETTRVLFTTYAPPGIAPEAVAAHLQTIQDLVAVISPEAEVEELRVYSAQSES